MHILVLSDFFPPQVNAGAENIAFEISNGYIAKGNRISVITINKSLQKGEVFVDEKKSLTCYQIGFNYNEKLSAYIGMYNPVVLKVIKKLNQYLTKTVKQFFKEKFMLIKVLKKLMDTN